MQQKIALEEHFAMPETVRDAELSAVHGELWPALRGRLLDLQDQRLAEMDKYGIEFVILSLNTPAIQAIPDAGRAAEIARRANDLLAENITKRPDRFGGFAALPMQDPEAASTELSRCVKDFGFKVDKVEAP